ncbi:hypothetical protein MNBD_GAMMA22-1103 [hydrothermal vent metagenome]|uniref:Uncharacterized protein n=1 Tax=hydrothermal vent metagenome TaxID=652676 RepID=A0A3B1AJK3_9ZZZZ
MNKMKAISMLFSATVLAVAASSASAEVFEKYPGTLCHEDRAGEDVNVRHIYGGALFSDAASWTSVNCPLTRKTGTGLLTEYTDATIYVKDLSTLGDIDCTIMNRSVLGSLGTWTSVTSTGVDTASYGQILSFGAEATGGFAGYSYLRCYLPPSDTGEYTQITDYTITY